MAIQVTYSHARANLTALLDRVSRDRATVIIVAAARKMSRSFVPRNYRVSVKLPTFFDRLQMHAGC